VPEPAPPINAKIMSQSSSKFWTFIGLPGSLLVLASAYYVKVPSARSWIDAHTPIARQLLGRYVPEAPATDDASPDAKDLGEAPAPGAPVSESAPPGSPSAGLPRVPQPVTYDLQTLARDQSLWPRQVRLRKPTKFPAVVDGKEVGSLVAPPGTEVNLRGIREGKLGLEFRGGGAWLPVEDTDLASRVPLR